MAVQAVTPLESRRVINGREGKVFGEGSRFLGWVESIEARITIDRADIVRSGTHVTGYKATGVSGTARRMCQTPWPNWRSGASSLRRRMASGNSNRQPPRRPRHLVQAPAGAALHEDGEDAGAHRDHDGAFRPRPVPDHPGR